MGADAILQLAIGSDGSLTPETNIAVPGAAVGVAIPPAGGFALVQSDCIDNFCDGELVPFAIGANGALTPAGSAFPLGSHWGATAVAFGASGMLVYVLTRFYGVDTVGGSLVGYSYTGDGELCAACPVVGFQIPPGAPKGEVIKGPALYVLVANGTRYPMNPAGGVLSYYASASQGGVPVNTGIPAGFPSAMVLVTSAASP
jgi:hypothetical protein